MKANVKAKRMPKIPEPSPRAVAWILAAAFLLLCAILGYDYAIGDSRMSWAAPHATAKPLNFNKTVKS